MREEIRLSIPRRTVDAMGTIAAASAGLGEVMDEARALGWISLEDVPEYAAYKAVVIMLWFVGWGFVFDGTVLERPHAVLTPPPSLLGPS